MDQNIFHINTKYFSHKYLIFFIYKVNQWTNGVVESCLASLTKLQKPFKYIVTCVIMQVYLVRN